jgi:integrase
MNGLAGATKQTQDAKGKILEFMWWLKKKGYREATILTDSQQLSILAKRSANLSDPDSVRAVIANQPWTSSRKSRAVAVYTLFLKMQDQTWEPPIYKPVPQIPFIPIEKEVDDLIAGSGRKLSAYLQLLKETGMRSGEEAQLKWTDLDFERNVVKITPEKNSYPRILPLSSKCVMMLKNLKRSGDLMFGRLSCNCMRISLCNTRKKLARKLNNPRLEQIHFHTIRHWKATTLHHQTRDILHVKQFMGHRRIESTLVYVQIESALFQNMSEDFTCKVAQTSDEAKQLIESGFEYVMQKDSLAYFRKRK